MPRSSTLRRATLGLAGGLPLLVAGVGLAAPAATAAPANATVSVGAGGLVYTGLAGANDITVKLSGTSRFVITDNGPITAGAGCLPGAKGTFEVHCQVPKDPNGTIRSSVVDGGAGHDRIRNLTAVGMTYRAGAGNDVVEGGSASDDLRDNLGRDTLRGNGGPDVLSTQLSPADGLRDIVEGGAGADDMRGGQNDDLRGGSGSDVMQGGMGADTFDGGSGSADAVIYLDGAHPVTGTQNITIDNTANDGVFDQSTSSSAERDNVRTSVEQVFGAHGRDVISGSEFANLLHGNLGDDSIAGGLGKDDIDGGPGNDALAGNKFFGAAANVADGAIDTLDGNSDVDTCRVPGTIEADITISCEAVVQ